VPSKLRISINAVALYIENIITTIIGIVVVYYLSRYLGPERFGQFNFITSYVVLFYMISELGIGQIVVREISKQPQKRDTILGAAMILKLSISVISTFLCITMYYILKYDLCLVVGLLIYSSKLVFSFMNLSTTVYRASFRNHISSAINLCCKILYLCLILLIIRHKLSLNIVILSLALTEILMDVMRNVVLKKEVSYRLNFDFVDLKNILVECIPLALSIALITLYMKINIMILVKMTDFNQVGIYSAAEKIVQLLNVIPQNLSIVLFPLYSMYSIADKKRSVRILQKSFGYLSITGIILAVGMYIYSSFFISMLYGNKFINSIDLMKIFAVQIIFIFMGIPLGNYLIAIGKQKINLINDALALLINIVLCFILIPRYGIYGAAFAAVITKIFLSIFMLWYFKFVLKIDLKFNLLFNGLILMCGIIIFLAYFKALYNPLCVVLAFIIYVLCLLRFRVINYQDLLFLRNNSGKQK
jgi:O-antigen/teichoic acid export membrane protein